ncbi:hypothetical protein Y032_0009g774 [Ancylostoma ceylanicum]|nr:hypothetical protein Y032_0009g774 [Ancylostoma ceylanicum]
MFGDFKLIYHCSLIAPVRWFPSAPSMPATERLIESAIYPDQDETLNIIVGIEVLAHFLLRNYQLAYRF